MARFLYWNQFPGIVIRILLFHFKNDQKIIINILSRKLDDHNILVKFQGDFDQNIFKEWDNHRSLVKFLQFFDQNSGGQQFRWLLNPSKIRWLWNSFEILQGFWSDIFLKIKWPRNCYEILQGFWSEFWLSAIVSNNSDDYEILQELDDNRILVKFFWIWSEFLKT